VRDAFLGFAAAIRDLPRLLDQARKEGSAGGTDLETALWMPLDAQDKLLCGWMFHVERRVIRTHFDRFDHAIFGGTGDDSQACAWCGHGLVVTCVDGQP
jgi:hypothetical protein